MMRVIDLLRRLLGQKNQSIVRNYEAFVPNQELHTIFNQEFFCNQDYKRRDEILKINVDWDTIKTGTLRFDGLTITQLESLLLERFIDPEDRQNSAPSVREFYEFMCKYSQFSAFGYAVSPKRNDYRISLEGIYYLEDKVNSQTKNDFISFCSEADEIITDGKLYGWWD